MQRKSGNSHNSWKESNDKRPLRIPARGPPFDAAGPSLRCRRFPHGRDGNIGHRSFAVAAYADLIRAPSASTTEPVR